MPGVGGVDAGIDVGLGLDAEGGVDELPVGVVGAAALECVSTASRNPPRPRPRGRPLGRPRVGDSGVDVPVAGVDDTGVEGVEAGAGRRGAMDGDAFAAAAATSGGRCVAPLALGLAAARAVC